MTRATSLIALCAAMPIADGEAGAAPEWLHLLPASTELRTVDGRGPYRVTSLQAVVDAFKPGEKLVLDENHSTDLAAPRGESAPAVGWIVALQAREDGIWGQVEWNGIGRGLMENRAYRGLSPAVVHDKAKNVLAIARASLTNTPNLKGLVALHSENQPMDFKAMLIELLGLDSDASDEAIAAALKAKLKGGDGDKPEVALQAVLAHPSFVAQQTQLTTAQSQIATLIEGNARRDAVAFVDAAIAEGRAGLPAGNAEVREEYISLHMANPEQAQRLVAAMPKMVGSSHAGFIPPSADAAGLDTTDRQVMALFGVSEEDYKAEQARLGKKTEAL